MAPGRTGGQAGKLPQRALGEQTLMVTAFFWRRVAGRIPKRLHDAGPTATKLVSDIGSQGTHALEATMFEVNPCARASRGECHFNFGFTFPVGGAPGEHDPHR